MRIVLPMAGYGTRLRPLTLTRPKPLLCVAGKPVLAHVLDMLPTGASTEEVVFIIGHLGGQVRQYVQRAYPHLKARFVEQNEMIGQSHAIWLAREGLRGPMLMLFVDTLIEADFSIPQGEQANAIAWVREVDDPRRFGVAEVDPSGWVRRIVEKPQDVSNNLAVVGCYYFGQAERLVEAIDEQMQQDVQLGGEYYLADAINIMLQDGLRMRVRRVKQWLDCGKPEAMLETNRYLLEHGSDNTARISPQEGLEIAPPVFIHPTAKVQASVIGPHASIGPACRIERSRVQDSIIEDHAHLIDATLSACMIGRHARAAGSHHGLVLGDAAVAGDAQDSAGAAGE
jgi:glucose-1-phosphate thymidylyltransferase